MSKTVFSRSIFAPSFDVTDKDQIKSRPHTNPYEQFKDIVSNFPRSIEYVPRPPEFYDATLNENTDFTDVEWPEIPGDKFYARVHRAAYERLRKIMSDHKKRIDEHMFLRLELHCRENEDPKSIASYVSRAFRVVSDYGWSITRPSITLLIIWFIGFISIFSIELIDYKFGEWVADTEPEYLGVGQSAVLSFSNIFNFIGIGRQIMKEEIESLTAISEGVSVVQMFTSPFIIFVLILALRNRFRL